MHGTSGDFTFGYQNDGTVLGFTETVVDEFFQLVYFGIELRNDGCFGTGSDGSVQARKPASRPMTSTKNRRS